MTLDKNHLIELYRSYTGFSPVEIIELPSSGSNRRYFRLRGNDGQTLIGVLGNNLQENEAFLDFDSQFVERGLPVPAVVAVSSDRMAYLQTDLGDTLLCQAIEKGRLTHIFSPEERELLAKTIRLLPKFQFAGADGFDFSKSFPTTDFDRRSIMWDLNYFKYCFLKATGLEFEENLLEDDFGRLADDLLQTDCDTFMYRDFQSRNVMIHDSEPWFIDFQGGRRGPYFYDVASFLWQAKANFSPKLRTELIAEYIDAAKEYREIDPAQFMQTLSLFVLFRTLQVLGAYGFRGYFEKKPHFMQSVPFAVANLRNLLADYDFSKYPYLSDMLTKLVDLKQFSSDLDKRTLTVRVFSFAYKKGIPNDASGNGGGYVFDCRGVNNPGKYERYKPFTGLDKQVIDFLEEDGEIISFLDHCYALVDASTQRYIDRGFTNLFVAFGCTGGRHRSVYCAQHMAEHLSRKFNVKVELIHREQNIEQLFPRR
ncbi:MAG: phosphotransferase [Muribaculaceae bacterium]|nr:phosphotransferase [Muribaculaceae bacterium]